MMMTMVVMRMATVALTLVLTKIVIMMLVILIVSRTMINYDNNHTDIEGSNDSENGNDNDT